MEKQKSANLLDLMTPEEREKVSNREQQRSNVVTNEWLGLAELGFYYGWEAVKDLLTDVITLKQAHILVEGARKIHSGQVYDQAVASLAGNSTKKGNFEKLMKNYIKDMKATQ